MLSKRQVEYAGSKGKEIDVRRDNEGEVDFAEDDQRDEAAYDSLEERKRGLDIRFVRAEEQVNELKTEISYYMKKWARRALEEEKETVRN